MALTRSEWMARIRSENTGPERLLRRRLHAAGLRYRLHGKTPEGRADIVSAGRRIAVFVDGCFWHGCPDHYSRPRTDEARWSKKLRGNVDRDRRQTIGLEAAGWTVLRFWECELASNLDRVVRRVCEVWGGKRARKRRRWVLVEAVPLTPDGLLERRTVESLRDGTIARSYERARYVPRPRLPRMPRNPSA